MRTIDVFTHFTPPGFLQKFQAWAPDQGMFRRSTQVKTLVEIDARLRLMDEFDDYSQIISLGSPPIEAFCGLDRATELARIANDGLAEIVSKHSTRFAGFLAALPLNNANAAVAEAMRATPNSSFSMTASPLSPFAITTNPDFRSAEKPPNDRNPSWPPSWFTMSPRSAVSNGISDPPSQTVTPCQSGWSSR